jgi:hypothetical protein
MTDDAAFFSRTVLHKPKFDDALGELHQRWEMIK